MTFIVGQGCINCKHTDCVEVCPVDCFYEGENTLVINPDECIDCGLCEPECPIEAIYAEDEVPADQIEFIEINEKYSKDIINERGKIGSAERFTSAILNNYYNKKNKNLILVDKFKVNSSNLLLFKINN